MLNDSVKNGNQELYTKLIAQICLLNGPAKILHGILIQSSSGGVGFFLFTCAPVNGHERILSLIHISGVEVTFRFPFSNVSTTEYVTISFFYINGEI